MLLMIGPLPRLFSRLGLVLKDHFYMPFVMAERWVRGTPTWKPIDLMLGVQPRTDADRKAADEHPSVIGHECDCGNPQCILNGKGKLYAWAPGFNRTTFPPMPAGMNLPNAGGGVIDSMAKKIFDLEEELQHADEASRLKDEKIAILERRVEQLDGARKTFSSTHHVN